MLNQILEDYIHQNEPVPIHRKALGVDKKAAKDAHRKYLTF
jgi:hypothetical protein